MAICTEYCTLVADCLSAQQGFARHCPDGSSTPWPLAISRCCEQARCDKLCLDAGVCRGALVAGTMHKSLGTLAWQPSCLHQMAACTQQQPAVQKLTLAPGMQMCQVSFQEWQLLPMGSYPRITDGRTPLQLYGPVQSIMCPSYNRAMSAFLSCTKVSSLGLHKRAYSLVLKPTDQSRGLHSCCV